MSKPSFVSELRRRNVIRMAGLYLVAAWLITQVASTVLPMFAAPEWLPRSVVLLMAIGFVPALIFAWVFEITPDGLKRESQIERSESITPETGQRMDRAIIVVLALALIAFAVDRFVLAPRREAKAVAVAVAAEQVRSGTMVAGASSIPTIEADPSIAVLPLVNMSSDKEQEYFSDGISEELLNLLAKVPQLRVIARTSSFSFKGKNTPIGEIAKVLNVAAVLEGSVRKSGDTVRITVQLIRAIDGTHLWSETYDRRLDDIFKVQDEIAAAVVAQLQIKLLGEAPKAKPVNPKAYPLLLQADALSNMGTAEGRAQAIVLLQQVLAIDPNEARAWAGLARNYLNHVFFTGVQREATLRRAREAMDRALALDPGNLRALSVRARLAFAIEHDAAAAAESMKRALRSNPNNPSVLNNSAVLLAEFGRIDATLDVRRHLLTLDPANVSFLLNLAVDLMVAGRWEEVAPVVEQALRLSPQAAQAHSVAADALFFGKRDAAAALARYQQEPDELSRLLGIAVAQHALGRTREADAFTQEFIDKFGKDLPYKLAGLHAQRGQHDLAFQALDRAVAQSDPDVEQAVLDVYVRPLHDDPRWLPFLKKIGLDPETLAKIEFEVTLPESGNP